MQFLTWIENRAKNNLSQEEWKTFRDTIYMVSNLGRVKNAKTNKLLKGKISNSGYREYCLTFNNRKSGENSFLKAFLKFLLFVNVKIL